MRRLHLPYLRQPLHPWLMNWYTTTPDQVMVDPIETARHLAPAIEAAMEREPDRLYTFKR